MHISSGSQGCENVEDALALPVGSYSPVLYGPCQGALQVYKLVLIWYHHQFGAGVLFRHSVRNIAVNLCHCTSILFMVLSSLAHKMLGCIFSAGMLITLAVFKSLKYYFYGTNHAVNADKHWVFPIAVFQKVGCSATVGSLSLMFFLAELEHVDL